MIVISKAKARRLVQKAVRDKLLKKVSTQTCRDCAKQAKHYDHREYQKPLKVDPVCQSCNLKRGPAIDAHTTPDRLKRMISFNKRDRVFQKTTTSILIQSQVPAETHNFALMFARKHKVSLSNLIRGLLFQFIDEEKL